MIVIISCTKVFLMKTNIIYEALFIKEQIKQNIILLELFYSSLIKYLPIITPK